MGWLYQEKENHKCKLPTYETRGAKVGDIWQCDECKVMWAVQKIHYDQRDGDWLSFVQYHGPVPEQKKAGYAVNDLRGGIYAPGTK